MSKNEVVLITGASSGIGREFARLFAADGSDIILTARREDRLKELADELLRVHGTKTTIIPLDLAAPNAAVVLVQKIEEAGLQVDTLINNAGFGQMGRFVEIPLARQVSMIQLNITALVELSHLLLPGMLARKRGAILNIASTAAFQPGPNVNVYYATKAFVLNFSEALWKELQGTGVSVTCLCPGPTRTEFGDESAMHDTPVFKHNAMSVDAVTKAGYRGLRKKKRLVMPGLINNLLSFSVRFTPRAAILDAMTFLQPIKRAK
ncbi:SDR family NAD(P)-dependent oxidoreductase [Planctomicrobium sp. SH668]|uniref:SDR family NAD(P)-dependent oxidoreductase n=1 Tax=Planctomicrobium sp. SH668 TaxID=3448126 RepID=UPI003F5C9ED9